MKFLKRLMRELINEIIWSDTFIELRRDPVIRGNHLEINKRIARLQKKEQANV